MKNVIKWIGIVFPFIIPTLLFSQEDTLSFKNYLLGDLSMNALYAAYVFSGIGLFLRWAYITKKGIKNSTRTPRKFSFWFWIKDNFVNKIVISGGSTLALLFLTYRFAEDLVGKGFSMAYAAALGLSIDYVWDVVMKWNIKQKTQ